MNWTKAKELERWGAKHDAAKRRMDSAIAAGMKYMRENGGKLPPASIQTKLERAHSAFLKLLQSMPTLG